MGTASSDGTLGLWHASSGLLRNRQLFALRVLPSSDFNHHPDHDGGVRVVGDKGDG